MIKQNQNEQKLIQKAKEEKVYTETTNSAKSNSKNTKGPLASTLINKNPDNNLVFLYW